jgi:hypothetical protein
MTAFAENFPSISLYAIVALLLVVSVIVIAICRNYHVRTGLRVGWISFFLETDRNEPQEIKAVAGKAASER